MEMPELVHHFPTRIQHCNRPRHAQLHSPGSPCPHSYTSESNSIFWNADDHYDFVFFLINTHLTVRQKRDVYIHRILSLSAHHLAETWPLCFCGLVGFHCSFLLGGKKHQESVLWGHKVSLSFALDEEQWKNVTSISFLIWSTLPLMWCRNILSVSKKQSGNFPLFPRLDILPTFLVVVFFSIPNWLLRFFRAVPRRFDTWFMNSLFYFPA